MAVLDERSRSSDRIATAEAGYVLQDRSLFLIRELTKVEWIDLGHRLARAHEASLWHLADWLLLGGRQGAGQTWNGSSYQHAAAITGYSISYLSAIWRVGETFGAELRGLGLSFSFYRMVVHRPDREALLHRAKVQRWTCDDLARHIETLPPLEPAETYRGKHARARRHGVYHAVEVTCPKCGHVFPPRRHRSARKEKEPV